MKMHLMTFFPILITIIYSLGGIVMLILIITWVNKYLSLKKEQNELLREIIRKMDRKD